MATATLFSPITGERKVVEGGSREANDLFSQGYRLETPLDSPTLRGAPLSTSDPRLQQSLQDVSGEKRARASRDIVGKELQQFQEGTPLFGEFVREGIRGKIPELQQGGLQQVLDQLGFIEDPAARLNLARNLLQGSRAVGQDVLRRSGELANALQGAIQTRLGLAQTGVQEAQGVGQQLLGGLRQRESALQSLLGNLLSGQQSALASAGGGVLDIGGLAQQLGLGGIGGRLNVPGAIRSSRKGIPSTWESLGTFNDKNGIQTKSYLDTTSGEIINIPFGETANVFSNDYEQFRTQYLNSIPQTTNPERADAIATDAFNRLREAQQYVDTLGGGAYQRKTDAFNDVLTIPGYEDVSPFLNVSESSQLNLFNEIPQ
jgi:hypothetical protein